MPDITFNLGNDKYKILANQWFERGDDGQCIIKFMHAPGRDMWILGLNFFQDYYAVFDYQHKRIGFAESINMGKQVAHKEKSFIEWATEQETPDNRAIAILNQEGINSNEAIQTVSNNEYHLLYVLFGLMALLFGSYVYIINKNKESKLPRVDLEDSEKSVHIDY